MTCDRFETEGLLQLERGEPLDPHFAACPDCREARAVYERLRQDLAALDAEEEPSPGWEARVWQRIEERKPRRSPWLWVLAPLGAAALAATLFFAIPRTPATPTLFQEVVQEGSVRRAESATPGDRLVLRAGTGEAGHAELRIYRNGRDLLLRCPGAPACGLEEDEITISFLLPSPGRYQAVLLLDDEPLPPPGKGLDPDAGAALDRGAKVLLGTEIDVR
jgi:hypothetical protein